MQVSAQRPSGPRLAGAGLRNNEITVTEEISIDSSRPKSRSTKMTYSTFPHKGSGSYDPIIDGIRPPTVPRPFSDFEAVSGGTLDLAHFLKNTGPPDEPVKRVQTSKHSSLRRGPLRRLFGHRPSQSDLKMQRQVPGLMQLPDSVVAKTASNGRRYLQISVPPGSDMPLPPQPDATPRSPTRTQKPVREDSSRPDTRDRPSTRDTQPTTQRSSGNTSTNRPSSGTEATRPSNSWGSTSNAMDEDMVHTYHSYLKNDKSKSKHEHVRIRPSPPRSKDASPSMNQDEFVIPKPVGRYPKHVRTTSSVYSDESGQVIKHGRAPSAVSEAMSTKSTSIHAHGLPPRTSSKQKLEGPQPVHIASLQKGPVVPSRDSSSLRRHQNSSAEAHNDQHSGDLVTPDGHGTHQRTGSTGTVGSTSSRKPPRPGPAPTRALPALPEARSESGSTNLKSSTHRDSKSSMQPKVPAPGLEPNTQSEEDSASPDRPASREAEATHGSSDSAGMSRKLRQEQTRARKMRDIISNRAQMENKKLDSEGDGHAAEGSSPDQRSSHKVTKSLDSGLPLNSITPTRTVQRHSALEPPSVASGKRMSREARKRLNGVSPIMLVMEQEPASGGFRTGGYSPRIPRRHQSINLPENPSPQRSVSPSLPSSDEETAYSSSRVRRGRPHISSRSIDVGAAPASSIRSSSFSRQAEFENRLSIMERKNTLLEAALMAVLNSAANMGSLSRSSSQAGHHSNDLGSSSPRPTQLESLLENMELK